MTAITTLTLESETIILEVNETIFVQDNPTSILSTFQCRENGVVVDDKARRHGGQQNLVADELVMPLCLCKGLLTVQVREPTTYEIQH